MNLKTSNYLFEHFTIDIMMKDMRFSRKALVPGQRIDNLEVITSDSKQIRLYDLAENKPLLIVTGSFTCPMTVSSLPQLKKLEAKLKGKVAFALLYVREAHPGENIPQSQSLAEKSINAERLRKHYGISWPTIIDDLLGPLHYLLDTKPNSAHLINQQGEILFQSLWAGDIAAINDAVISAAVRLPVRTKMSQRIMRPFLLGAGFMDDTLRQAGKGAYKELALGAPPIALLSRIASFFHYLPQKNRGFATVATMAGLFLILGSLILGL